MSIDYKLADELKWAGFSQEENYGGYTICPHVPKPDENGVIKITEFEHGHKNLCEAKRYVPSLSELIEACEGSFDKLERKTIFTGSKWVATGTDNYNGGVIIYTKEGSTPEIAVAHLYLALKGAKIK